MTADRDRLEAIKGELHDGPYCSNPECIDDVCWLVAEVERLRSEVGGFMIAVQKAADCLSSGTGAVSSQAYAKRADSCLAVLVGAGAATDDTPPVWNPFDEQVAKIRRLRDAIEDGLSVINAVASDPRWSSDMTPVMRRLHDVLKAE